MRLDPVALEISSLAIAGVVATAIGVSVLRRTGTRAIDRLAVLQDHAEPTIDDPPAAGGLVASLVAAIAVIAQPTTGEAAERLRERLQHGGVRSARAANQFRAAKVVLGGASLGLALLTGTTRALPLNSALFFGVLAFALGFYLPDAWLLSRTRARQLAIERALPDALDLLVTCVEAGLGLDAALQRVADELRLAWPVLAHELETTFLEAKAGIARTEAFRRLAGRTGVKELKSLAATLTQTEIFGTSVALALRVQGEGIRTRRMQRAEEKAAYASVKMTIPLIACILPSLMAVVVGPAVVNIARRVLPLLGGK
jgi:tight adherence protein C